MENCKSSGQPLVRRVGVINWDCGLPSTTFFGGYACKSLGPKHFRDRTPYYAVETAPDAIEMPERTKWDFDDELRHAITAGIDYFAYCWYDRTPPEGHVTDGDAKTADGHLQELTKARLMHLASDLKSQIGLCAILVTSHPYSDTELEELLKTMQEPYYEKVEGRPIVYLFPGAWEPLLERLQMLCQAAGYVRPYAVLLERWETPPEQLAKVDALSDYSGMLTGTTWEELVGDMNRGNDFRVAQGKPVIPHFATGWDPSPRIEHPVPWCSYPALNYAAAASPEQLLNGARQFKEWLQAHADACPTGQLLVFAWNEFEEGGWICPTWKPNGCPDTARRDAFAEMVKIWKG
ncbi:MAG: hypothetical protein J6Y80_05450 [Victivallales bacterium]|nr:hypothetical protein [Victivallales bacterium]